MWGGKGRSSSIQEKVSHTYTLRLYISLRLGIWVGLCWVLVDSLFNPLDLTWPIMYINVFWENFNLWRPLLMIALYHQTKTPISFWCRRGLNPRSLIQPSETLPVKLTGTHYINVFYFLIFIFLVWLILIF